MALTATLHRCQVAVAASATILGQLMLPLPIAAIHSKVEQGQIA